MCGNTDSLGQAYWQMSAALEKILKLPTARNIRRLSTYRRNNKDEKQRVGETSKIFVLPLRQGVPTTLEKSACRYMCLLSVGDIYQPL